MTSTPLRRRTKILATIGPASDGALRMEELLQAGVDVFRLNFSHGDHAQHAARIAAAREAENTVGRPLALLADLQGPKLRLGDLPGGGFDVRMSSELRLRAASTSDDPNIVPVPHPELISSLQLGDRLLIDDGKMSSNRRQRRWRRPHRAPARARPTLEPQGHRRAQPPDPDSGADGKRHRRRPFRARTTASIIIALSFVQRADDIAMARKEFGTGVPIIAKIEKPARARRSRSHRRRSRRGDGRARRSRRRTLARAGADRPAPHRPRRPHSGQAGDRRHPHAGIDDRSPGADPRRSQRRRHRRLSGRRRRDAVGRKRRRPPPHRRCRDHGPHHPRHRNRPGGEPFRLGHGAARPAQSAHYGRRLRRSPPRNWPTISIARWSCSPAQAPRRRAFRPHVRASRSTR